jgi:rRNA maturation endonuclease Nob1
MNIEERLTRIERKLFPENIKTLYDYHSRCNTDSCFYNNTHHQNFEEYPNSIGICPYCGSNLEIYNIYQHEEIIFE